MRRPEQQQPLPALQQRRCCWRTVTKAVVALLKPLITAPYVGAEASVALVERGEDDHLVEDRIPRVRHRAD